MYLIVSTEHFKRGSEALFRFLPHSFVQLAQVQFKVQNQIVCVEFSL